MLLKLSLMLFLLIGLGQILSGALYISTNEFMPYHSAAIETSWSDLNSNYQGLILGFLKLGGAGNLVTGLATVLMSILSIRHSVRPYRLLLPAVCFGYLLLTSYAAYTVNTMTAGDPPLVALLVVTTVSAVASISLWIADRKIDIT